MNEQPTMTVDEFDEAFDMLESPDKETLWNRREVAEAIEDGTIAPSQIWTVIDGSEDDTMYVVTGMHTVNVVGYVVTEQDHRDEFIEAIWFQPEEG